MQNEQQQSFYSEAPIKRGPDDEMPFRNKRQRSDNSLECRFLLKSKTAGAIIGKAGSNINRLRKDFRASVTVPDCPGPERILTVGAEVDTVKEILLDVIPKLDDYSHNKTSDFDCEFRMLVHQSHAGCIIGKGGTRIKELREKTGAQIKVYSMCCPNSTERVVQVSGTLNVVVECIKELCDIVLEVQIKGPVRLYDPHCFDNFMAQEYGGYADMGGGGRGGRGGRGRGGFFGGSYGPPPGPWQGRGGRGGPRGGRPPRGGGGGGWGGRGGGGGGGPPPNMWDKGGRRYDGMAPYSFSDNKETWFGDSGDGFGRNGRTDMYGGGGGGGGGSAASGPGGNFGNNSGPGGFGNSAGAGSFGNSSNTGGFGNSSNTGGFGNTGNFGNTAGSGNFGNAPASGNFGNEFYGSSDSYGGSGGAVDQSAYPSGNAMPNTGAMGGRGMNNMMGDQSGDQSLYQHTGTC